VTRPFDVLVRPNGEQQIELLDKQRVVVAEIEPEQRKGFYGRAAAHDHFCAPLGDQVKRRELLEDAHRIGGAKDCHRAGQANAPGTGGRRGENDGGRGVEKLFAVMLANPAHVQANLVGPFDAFEQLAYGLRSVNGGALTEQSRYKTIHAKLHTLTFLK